MLNSQAPAVPTTRSLLAWLLPLCALLLYTALAWRTRGTPVGPVKDEARYMEDAGRLLEGWLIKDDDPTVVNGPGYPLVIAAIKGAGLPDIVVRMANGVFIALAVWFLYRALLPVAGRRWTVAGCLLVMLHPSLLQEGRFVMTEALTVCCMCAFLYTFTALLRAQDRIALRVLAAALALGWLTMTRVVFGHVSSAMLVFTLAALVIAPRHRQSLLRAAAVFGLTLVLSLPWLLHTKSKTGHFPVWATTAPELQYWLTSAHPGENGHWFSPEQVRDIPQVREHHWTITQEVESLGSPREEEIYAAAVKENVRKNPRGVAMNWACNVCRLFFGFPRSFQPEKLTSAIYIPVNGPVIAAALLAICLAWRNRRNLPPEPALLLLMAAVYLGGSTLASAVPRYSYPAIPLVLYAAAAVFSRTVRISLTAKS
jgi:Dolichyl-phosphate-mannose-protein mannosyltransferase